MERRRRPSAPSTISNGGLSSGLSSLPLFRKRSVRSSSRTSSTSSTINGAAGSSLTGSQTHRPSRSQHAHHATTATITPMTSMTTAVASTPSSADTKEYTNNQNDEAATITDTATAATVQGSGRRHSVHDNDPTTWEHQENRATRTTKLDRQVSIHLAHMYGEVKEDVSKLDLRRFIGDDSNWRDEIRRVIHHSLPFQTT
jgi:hypothetical protein